MAWSEAEVAHRAASDAERIAWVDEQDRPLGGVLRSELRERQLIGRGTYILLFNSAGILQCGHFEDIELSELAKYRRGEKGVSVSLDEL